MIKDQLYKTERTCVKLIAVLTAISFLYVLPCIGRVKSSAPAATASGKGNCPACNFLLLGTDRSDSLTDVIMLVSLDSEARRVSVAQIPRDTYAEYTDSAYRKLNGALASLGGGRAVADFLENAFGITIDHYVTLDLKILAETVDMMGGVEVVVPEDMAYEDEYQDLSINLKAGKQILDGEKAVQFIRYRSGYVRGDIARLDAQKIFLSAFFNKLATCKKTKLVSVAQKLLTNTESDVALDDCLEIVSNATKMEAQNIKFFTMPGADLRTESGAWYYVLNKKETARMLDSYFYGSRDVIETDPDRLFTGEYSKEFNAIYDAESGYECKIYTAESINSGGIEIEKIKN